MFNVSEAYKSAMKNRLIENRVEGILFSADYSETQFSVPITDSNIVQGSLCIDNKAINGSEFCFGSIYIGQMTISLMDWSAIPKNRLLNGELQLSYFLKLEDGTEEEVPLGIFYIVDTLRRKKTVQLKCYDAMKFFDEPIETDMSGTPFQLMVEICEKIGVGFATTEEQMNLMCNPTVLLDISVGKVGTYRDAVSYIATVMGAFATINRYGKMELRQFHTRNYGYEKGFDFYMDDRDRINSSICDYETSFKSVTARFLADTNYYPYTETLKDVEEGLTLNLGDIPIVTAGEDIKHEVLTNILNYLADIIYTPCAIDIFPDPSIELGDCICNTYYEHSGQDYFIVTGICWTYRKGLSITSHGSDPMTSKVKSSTEKHISNMESSVSEQNVLVQTYTNGKDYSFSSSEQEIIKFTCSGSSDTIAIFLATIPLEMSLDGNLVLTYQVNSEVHSTITKYLERGSHFVSMSNYFPCKAGETVTIRVKAKTEYFESDKRQNDAKIVSIMGYIQNQTYVESSIDTTIPTAMIGMGRIRASVHAQGLVEVIAWDGTIEISEAVPQFVVASSPTFAKLTDTVQFNNQNPASTKLSQAVPLFTVASSPVFQAPVENVYMGYVIKSATRSVDNLTEWIFDEEYINTGDGKFALSTLFTYTSEEQAIDSGRMAALKIKTTDKLSVEGVAITSE